MREAPPPQFWGAGFQRVPVGARQAAPSVPFRLPRIGAGGLLLLLLLAFASPAHARPQVLVIFADHLTLSDISRPGLPHLAGMRRALLSPGLAHPPGAALNVYAALGAGDSVGVGDKSEGRMAGALRLAGVKTALIGDADGDDTGPYRPVQLFLPTLEIISGGGAAADPLACGGRRDDPARLWAATQAALAQADLAAVHFGDFARIERENQRGFLLPGAYTQHRNAALAALDAYVGRVMDGFSGPVYVVVPTPPLLPGGGWNSLTPLLTRRAGPASSLTSDTTQTPGLTAARDIAPAILTDLAVPVPYQMTGAPLRPVTVPEAALERLDRLVRLNQDAQNAIFWAVGLVAAAIVFSGLCLYRTGRLTGRAQTLARYGLRVLSAWPLALLLSPLLGPRTVAAYLAEIAGLVCLLALLPSPTAIFSVTALALLGDGVTGTRLVSNSALSEYALSGIRFYGIGNEYMGVLIGGALLASPFFGPKPPRPNSGEPTEKRAQQRRRAQQGQRAQQAAPLRVLFRFLFRLPRIGAGGPSFGSPW